MFTFYCINRYKHNFCSLHNKMLCFWNSHNVPKFGAEYFRNVLEFSAGSAAKKCRKVDYAACMDPLKDVFHQRSSSTKGCLQPKVVFHRRSSSTKGCFPVKAVFHQRSSSTEGGLPLKVGFPQRLSSPEGCLPPKVVFHQSSSSIHVAFVEFIRLNYVLGND